MKELRKAKKEELIHEAIVRMQIMGFEAQVIKDFFEGKIWLSKKCGSHVSAKQLSPTDKEMKIIKNYLPKDIFCFFATYDETEFGNIYTLFTISKYVDDWDLEENLLSRNISFAYCINQTVPDYSELGSIPYEMLESFPIRIW